MFTGTDAGIDFLNDIAVYIKANLIDPACSTTTSNACIQSKMSCAVSHNFNNRAAVMGLRSIAQTVDCLYSGIECGIKTNGVIGAGNIIVDGTWDTDTWNTL